MRKRIFRTSSVEADLAQFQGYRVELQQERNQLKRIVEHERVNRAELLSAEEHTFQAILHASSKRVSHILYHAALLRRTGMAEPPPGSIVARLGELLQQRREADRAARESLQQERREERINETRRVHDALSLMKLESLKLELDTWRKRRLAIDEEREQRKSRVDGCIQQNMKSKVAVSRKMRQLAQQQRNQRVVSRTDELRHKKRIVQEIRATSLSPSAFLQLPPIEPRRKYGALPSPQHHDRCVEASCGPEPDDLPSHR